MIATSISHYPKVGNGPGQQALRRAISRVERGELGEADLARVAEEVTTEVVKEQQAAGLDLVTDGQIRWQDPITYIAGALDGFEIRGLVRWFETNTYYRQPLAVRTVRRKAPILLDDFRFASGHADRPLKPVLTGPYTLGMLSQTQAPSGHGGLVLELASALNLELKELAAAGAGWIEVDEPAITNNPSVRYPRDFGLFAEAMAILTAGVDARLGLQLYHGSAEDIPGLFELGFALIGLDLVQGRRSWELLERWPPGMGLGLGIVDARNVRIEEEDELQALVERGAAAAGADAIQVTPSCGLEFLPRETARAKLELVARTARRAEAALV